MVVIYGYKEYVKPLELHPSGSCPHCGYHTQMSLTSVYKRTTLYYIPLFAFDKKVYAQCPHCGGYSEIKGNGLTEARKGRIDQLEAQDLKAVGTSAAAATVGEAGTTGTDGVAGAIETTAADGTIAAVGTVGEGAAPAVRAPWEKPTPEKKPGDGFRFAGILAIVFAIIFAICSVTGIYGASQRASRTYTPLNELLASGRELKTGDYVSIEIDAVIGNYASETGSNAKEYYMIWLDDNTMMSLETSNRGDIAALNRLAEDTWAYLSEEQSGLSGDTLFVKGVLSATDRMNSKLRGYYGDMAEQLGLQVGDEFVRPFHIRCIYDTDPNATKLTNTVFVALMIVCAVLAAVFFALAKKKRAAAEAESAA